MSDTTRLRVSIGLLDYQSEDDSPTPQPSEDYELVVRLTEREQLGEERVQEENCMYISMKEKGKIYWQDEMKDLDLIVQFKLLKKNEYVGSISVPFKDILMQPLEFEQWLTVFDTLQDDLFDGNLGEDDTEKPRILLSFDIAEDHEDDDDDNTKVTIPF